MVKFEIKQIETDKNYAKVEVTPLENGYGHTLGNTLRRIMLTSLPGAAITSVQIKGVNHQFSTLSGMKEDVLDFLLNLKRVKFDYKGEKETKVTLNVKKEGEVKASDIEASSDCVVSNPDFVIANLAKGGSLEATMIVRSGVGYIPSEEHEDVPAGYLSLDSDFSPVTKVSYKVEETRVGRVTNYDKLTMEIWTDGTVEPVEALKESARILMDYLSQVVTPHIVEVSESKSEEISEEVKETSSLGAVGKLSVEEIALPTRVANALAKAGFDTVEKLVNADKTELTKVRNLGEKSLSVIADALREKGVEF